MENLVGIAFALEGFARVATIPNQAHLPSLAPKLFSVAESLRESIESPMPIPDRQEYEQSIAIAKGWIDEDIFKAAWTTGRNLSVEQAIALALDTTR